MTSVSLQQLDNGDAFATNTDSAEQITKLFPKCRPRADVNLNPVVLVRSAVGNGGSSEREEPVTTDTFDISTTVTTAVATPTSPNAIAGIGVGASVGGAQDRIIEIAGGREIYSQSRTKASRKQRHEMKKGVWDVRARRGGSVTNVSSAVSAREVTETVFSTEVCSVRHRRATRGDSVEGVVTVVPPPTNNSGEVVVFDDIGENWRGEHGGGGAGNDDLDRTDVSQSECLQLQQQHENDEDEIDEGSSRDVSPPPPPCHRAPATDFFKVVASASDIDGDSPSPEPNGDEVAQVIGGLPIAVYEGSPRRYGPRESDTGRPSLPSAHSLLASPSVYPPRPGFPQRVVSTPGADGETQRCELSSNGGSPPAGSTFDYLYEFSETRKVLEEFFRRRPDDDTDCPEGSEFQDLDYELHRQASNADPGSSYVGQRLAKVRADDSGDPIRIESPRRLRTMRDSSRRAATSTDGVVCIRDHDTLEQENNFLDLSVGTGSSGDLGETEVGLQVGHSRNFTLSPETTDCDSNCGDLDSEMSLMLIDNELGPSSTGPLGSSGDLAAPTDSLRPYSSMPVLEDGLSSGHASDTDNNNPTVILMKRQITEIEREIVQRSHGNENIAAPPVIRASIADGEHEGVDSVRKSENNSPLDIPPSVETVVRDDTPTADSFESSPPDMNTIDTLTTEMTPPPPAPAPHRRPSETGIEPPSPGRVEAAIQDIRLALQRAKTLPLTSAPESPDEPTSSSPVWVPRQRGHGVTRGGDSDSGDGGRKVPSGGEDGGDEDEADTDLETDRLLGQQRTDDQGFYDDKLDKENKKKGRNKEGHIHDPSVLIEGVLFRARYLGSTQLVCEGQPTKSTRMMQAEEAVSRIKEASDRTTRSCRTYDRGAIAPPGAFDDDTAAEEEDDEDDDDDDDEDEEQECSADNDGTSGGASGGCGAGGDASGVGGGDDVRSGGSDVGGGAPPPPFAATGTVFRLQFLGSVEVEEEGGRKRRKRLKKNMVEEAVSKIKAPDGESQPSTEVDLFISTEKIMVLNTDLKEIMMDHALRTISYIADIGDLVVLMARRRLVPHEMDDPPKINRTPKMICHVFESEEAQFIAQSIGQAFQVAYMEFLKANGIEDHSFVKEMDYQEVLNSQEIFGDELQMFAKKEMQKEVVVPKAKGEILGVVIVESGWGSMLPTVVIANLAPAGAAARCGQLNIGDQIIAINGVSLVGLPLSTCQNYIKNSKNQTVVKLTVVPCAPVVEVKIKRPDTKYQLGFSVQNGVICSLLRGGIAERGGVRVGHRIIEINNQSVVAVPHEKIVNLLATSVGEILMKTMPTSMFRLLTGQENPVYI